MLQSPSTQLTNTSVSIGTTGVPVDRDEPRDRDSFNLTIEVCYDIV